MICDLVGHFNDAVWLIKEIFGITESQINKAENVIFCSQYSACWWSVTIRCHGPGARFTNGFSIAIQIRWEFRFALTSILMQWSLQIFVHGTTAVLSWHVQNLLQSNGQQQSYGKAKFPSNLNCGQKNVSETGPWGHSEDQIWFPCINGTGSWKIKIFIQDPLLLIWFNY